MRRLAAEAQGNGRVHFAGAVADDDLPALYGHCRSFVFPGLEDFGITPLEATAAGRPVVAFGQGGVIDTVREGLNGVFFAAQTVEALVEALHNPELDRAWDVAAMESHARTFGLDRYRREMAEQIGAAWADRRGRA